MTFNHSIIQSFNHSIIQFIKGKYKETYIRKTIDLKRKVMVARLQKIIPSCLKKLFNDVPIRHSSAETSGCNTQQILIKGSLDGTQI